ncbi:MAG: cell division protein FtsL, partial [Synergistetes bacterium HGW-Synergistetes-2]
REGLAPREGASNALSLLNALLEGGDPARWESASGFFLPSFVPKPLAAADAVYAAALHLLRMDGKGASELAGMLFERLLDSPKGKYFFISAAPAEYSEIVRILTQRDVVPSFGKWPEGVVEGRLPLGAPVRGRVSRDRAISEGMTFLNGAGQPVPNGMYAWDRKRGRIYDVVDVERRRFWLYD